MVCSALSFFCLVLCLSPPTASSFFCLPLFAYESCSRPVRERKPAKSWDRFPAQQEAPPTMTAILQPALVSLYHITLHCIQVAYLQSAMRSHPDFLPHGCSLDAPSTEVPPRFRFLRTLRSPLRCIVDHRVSSRSR